MPLSKSKGQMYDWVTHMHTHLRGRCLHGCTYCYAFKGPGGRTGHYDGPVRLAEKELAVDYGTNRTIFLEHMHDLFGPGIEHAWRARILQHACRYPANRYVLQSKNSSVMEQWAGAAPDDTIFGTTIETNRIYHWAMGNTPSPMDRAFGLRIIREKDPRRTTFVTIEPIMDFDIPDLAALLILALPTFVNIGADSKGGGLVEPPAGKVRELIAELQEKGFNIRKKLNLERLS